LDRTDIKCTYINTRLYIYPFEIRSINTRDSIFTSLIRSIILRAEMALRIEEWGYTCRREVQGREDVLGRDIPLSLCRLNGHAHGSW